MTQTVKTTAEPRHASQYAREVERFGLSESHQMLLRGVPSGSRVLDVGCATGYLAAQLSSRACDVTGIEFDGAAADAARGAGIAVLHESVEDPSVIAAALAAGPYNVILYGDVLEHLRDPRMVLLALRPSLDGAGRAIVSLPNIAHWTARRHVLWGRFPQDDVGLFDRTHLRFFTRASAHALVQSAGYQLLDEGFVRHPLPFERRLRYMWHLQGLAAALRPELFALQFVMTIAAVPDCRV